MNKRNISKLNNIQLQQKIIYLQSELALRDNQLKNYQENYHYIKFENLKLENEQLQKKLIEKEEVIKMILEDQSNDKISEQLRDLKETIALVNEENNMMREVIDKLEIEKESLNAKLEDKTKVEEEITQEQSENLSRNHKIKKVLRVNPKKKNADDE